MDATDYQAALERCAEELATRLGMDEIPNDVWGYVVKLGLPLAPILGGRDADWQELMNETRVRLKDLREEFGTAVVPPDRARRDVPEEVAVELSEYSNQRGQVLSEVAAALAKLNPRVRRTRQELFGGPEETVDAQEASKLLQDMPRSSLARHNLIGDLGSQYGWRSNDAAWFVLTGQAPPIRPVVVKVDRSRRRYQKVLRDHYLETVRITIAAHVWVRAEEVEKVFRDVQRQVLGGDNRSLRKRSLDVARFVARQIEEHGREPWSKRWGRWKRYAPPEWGYKNERQLRQVFMRFTRPGYKEFQIKDH